MADEPTKVQRLPSRHACKGCRKRKQRCDGQRPQCGGCRSRRLECHYSFEGPAKPSRRDRHRADSSSEQPSLISTPSAEESGRSAPQAQWKGNAVPTGSSRPGSVSALQGVPVVPARASSDVSLDSRTPLASTFLYPNTLTADPTCWQRVTSSTTSDAPAHDSELADGYYGGSSAFAFVSKVPRETQNLEGVHLHHGQAVGSASTSPQGLHDKTRNQGPANGAWAKQLPERILADNLVDAYFDRVHPLYPFLHEGSFRAEYENMWGNGDQAQCRRSWFGLANAVFALGCEFCEDVVANSLDVTVTCFLDRSRSVVLPQISKRGSLEHVQALLLLCHYLQGALELNECWTLAGWMIRTAYSIGLHLDADSLSISSVEKEVRKRAWWGCFALDQTLSMKFGRPASMRLEDAQSVPHPLAVDDQYIHHEARLPRQPIGRPSIIEFFNHTIQLTCLIDDILRNLYSTTKRVARRGHVDSMVPEQQLAELIVLDERLRSWWHSKPSHLALNSSKWDSPVYRRQQTVTRIRYLQIMILLQRPLLLMFSRESVEDELIHTIALAGSQTCLAAALESMRLISEQYHQQRLNSISYNLHYVFTSLGVLLHMQNMDRSKLTLVDPEQLMASSDALDHGMEFLRNASHNNPLASRYLAMLQHVRDLIGRNALDGMGNDRDARNLPHQQPNHTAAVSADSWLDLASWQTQRYITGDEFDLDGLDLDGFFFGP